MSKSWSRHLQRETYQEHHHVQNLQWNQSIEDTLAKLMLCLPKMYCSEVSLLPRESYIFTALDIFSSLGLTTVHWYSLAIFGLRFHINDGRASLHPKNEYNSKLTNPVESLALFLTDLAVLSRLGMQILQEVDPYYPKEKIPSQHENYSQKHALIQ